MRIWISEFDGAVLGIVMYVLDGIRMTSSCCFCHVHSRWTLHGDINDRSWRMTPGEQARANEVAFFVRTMWGS